MCVELPYAVKKDDSQSCFQLGIFFGLRHFSLVWII